MWPNDYNGKITANFCEPRTHRFHAGIDVRTYGEIGSNLYAIDSGMIQRISIKPNNYGKAIYLQLNDGNIVLYSHLNNFNNEIDQLVKTLYKKYNSSFFDHYLNENEKIEIKKGEIIGYTGDTGSLSGPHLHFEIRNNKNEPINPLDFYHLDDTIPPLVNSITLIPLSPKTWIDGIQDYKTFNLKKINANKYVIQDTISAIGEFGISVETFDKINNLSFKYGVYKIDMLIDNILLYSIKFDNYNFSEDHMIYSAIDYYLLKKNKISHRLFINESDDLSFIKSNNNGKIIIDDDFHNLIINISDYEGNITQIQGVLKGEFLENQNINIKSDSNKLIISRNQMTESELNLKILSKYNYPIDKKTSLDKKNNNKYVINNFNKNSDIIEFFLKNKNGIKSNKSFASINQINPYEIKGEIKIKHLESGIIIEFLEDVFSGYQPILEIESNGLKTKYPIYRKEKNLLSSEILNIKNITNISFIYDTKPEIIFDKKINSIHTTDSNELSFHGYTIDINENSFYNETLVLVNKSTNSKEEKNEKFKFIGDVITIYPNEIPFKDGLTLGFKIENCETCGLYKYSYEDENWFYLNSSNESNKIKSKIKSGGTFCILSENQEPKITDLKPSLNSKYRIKDLDKLTFNLTDELSGINPYNVSIKINDKSIFYDYIKYRNFISSDIQEYIRLGKNKMEIFIYDNIGNKNIISGVFEIVE